MVDKLEACAECGMTGALCSSSDGEVAWIRCQYCRREGPLAYSAEEAARGWNAGEERSRKPTPANGEQVEREDAAVAAIESTGLLAGDEARDAARAVLAATPTEDARERVKVLEQALLRIAETDRHTRRVKCNPNGGLRGQAGMIAVFALTGKNGSHLTDADVRTVLGNKETDRHG